MQIGIFTESFDPVINGVTTSVHALADELQRLGQKPIVIAPRFAGYSDAPATVPVQRLPSWRTPLNPQNPFAYPAIGPVPTVLRDLPLDIVHTQHPFGIGQHAARTANRLRVPLIATFHTLYTEYGHYVPFLPSPLVRSVVAAYLRRYYRHCEAIIVPSQEAGRRLVAVGVAANKLLVIPTGVPDAAPVAREAIEAVRAQYALTENIPVVLYVGRLAREKNLTLLLQAFQKLLTGWTFAENNAPVLMLVGSGPAEKWCRETAEQLGVMQRLRFTGFVPHAKIGAYYATATVFAFPSSSETQGVVLCEAQSYGLPCVVVNGGGAPEFVRDGGDGLIVASETIPFAEALTELLTNHDRRRAFAEAAPSSPRRLTPAQAGEQVLALYQYALQKTARRE